MKEPKFNNRQNECIIHENREYWISRSVAVVGIILAHVGNDLFVLTEKRSAKMDQPLKRSLVCGYMDWDENGIEAIKRETYEETGLILDKLKHDLLFNNNEQPYFVKTDPGENRQNITLNYIFQYNFGSDGHYCMLETEKFTSEEVDSVDWINVNDLDDYNWAFEHPDRIRDALAFLNIRN